MIQTVLAIVVFTVLGVWYVGRQPVDTRTPQRSSLLTPKLYAGLLALAALLVLLWR